VNDDGLVYVADTTTHRMQVFRISAQEKQ
jgi:hypothetical protein